MLIKGDTDRSETNKQTKKAPWRAGSVKAQPRVFLLLGRGPVMDCIVCEVLMLTTADQTQGEGAAATCDVIFADTNRG